MKAIVTRLPHGARLSDVSLAARHQVIVTLLWLHVPALAVVGLIGPRPRWESATRTFLPHAAGTPG